MITELEKAKQHLIVGGYTCVLCKDQDIHTSFERGVKPLLMLLESGKSFKGYSAADKVVGKATAFLYVMLGVKAVYAKVISRSALQVLKENNIYVENDVTAENIINRAGDGICPFESAVLDIKDTDIAYKTILQKVQRMRK